MLLKQIRIEETGKIAKGDRRVHTTTSGLDPDNPSRRGADQVQWLAPGAQARAFTIRFGYLAGSPFASGHSPTNPHDIKVPGGAPLLVSQAAGIYKYDVFRNDKDGNPAGPRTDDPDVVID